MEILKAALELMAEHGYRGASLRALADRVGVQQPSLYHWFESKEQLAEQIVTHLGPSLLLGAPPDEVPEDLLEMPRVLVDATFRVWSQREYVSFVRLVLALSSELPRFRVAARALYREGLELGVRVLFQRFLESGEITELEARTLTRTAVNGIGLLLMEERAIEGRAEPSADARAYGDALVALLRDGLTLRRSQR